MHRMMPNPSQSRASVFLRKIKLSKEFYEESLNKISNYFLICNVPSMGFCFFEEKENVLKGFKKNL
jgi:hypothetical protein